MVYICSARLQPRAGAGLPDPEGSHYNCLVILACGLVTLSAQGAECLAGNDRQRGQGRNLR